MKNPLRPYLVCTCGAWHLTEETKSFELAEDGMEICSKNEICFQATFIHGVSQSVRVEYVWGLLPRDKI